MQNMDVPPISLIDENDDNLVYDTADKPWLQSAYPLHILARNGDLSEIESLLQSGEDVNKEDLLSTRPLHVAALFGNNDAAKLFLEYGADVNDNSYYGITALFLAIESENFDTALILLAHGADPMANAIEEYTPYELAVSILFDHIDAYEQTENTKILPTIDALTQILKEMGPDCYFYMGQDPDETEGSPGTLESLPYNLILKALASGLDPSPQKEALLLLAQTDLAHENYYLNAKALLHVFPTGNNYDLSFNDQKQPLNANGHISFYTTPFIMNSLEAYVAKLENSDDLLAQKLFAKIEKSYILGTEFVLNATDSATCEKALDIFDSGETILLPSGWAGHFVNIILSKSQSLFASANSGQRYDAHEAGVTFYKIYDSNDIDATLIYNVLNNNDQSFLEYTTLYHYGLFEKTDFIPGDNQEYGNCALQSHREAIRGLLYIELLNEGMSQENAHEQTEIYFQEWNTYLSHYTLREYFSENVGLPAEAYTDIFLDLNLDHDKPLSQSDKNISQTLVNALMTPQYLPEFNGWLKEAVGNYGKEEIQHAFEPYGVDVSTMISHPLHYHKYYVMPEHVTDPLDI